MCTTHNSTSGTTTAYQQQHRLLSHLYRTHHLQAAPHPHRQFILDLQSWLEHLIKEDYDIILTLDANEPYNPDVPVAQHPLSFQPGIPMLDKRHDGKLSTLIATCGLQDPLARPNDQAVYLSIPYSMVIIGPILWTLMLGWPLPTHRMRYVTQKVVVYNFMTLVLWPNIRMNCTSN